MQLAPHDHDRLIQYYDDAFKAYGDTDARSVHWSDSHNQILRFEILLGVGNLDDKKILDVGCGLGDLYSFLKKKETSAEYTGIDVVPDFIEKAKQLHPEVRFEFKDIFDMNEKFDVVLASGALSFKVENHEEYYKSMIRKMYDLARESVAFNMLDKSIHIDDDTYAAYSPHDISDFCKTFCENVQIVTGYLPQDFTVYLYKNIP